jgi:hypothetical protein
MIPVAVGLGTAFAAEAPLAGLAKSGAEQEPAFLWNSFFVGARSSLAEAGEPAFQGDARLASTGADPKLPDIYLGYRTNIDGVTVGATALYVSHSNLSLGDVAAVQDASLPNAWKFKAGASANLYEGLQFGINLQFTPDGLPQTGDLPLFDSSALKLGGLAHNGGPHAGVTSQSDPYIEDWRYDVGVSFSLSKQSKVDLRYYKTIEGAAASCVQGCPPDFAAALQTRF